MYAEDEYSKFTKNLSKLVKSQWTKFTRSSSGSLKSEKNIDQQLEEEYETLLREIDYLTSEKSCYLSFMNDKFNHIKSSEDLSNILKKHSSEVLKSYIKKFDGEKGNGGSLNDRNDLINYITEIVVSRHKCNNKLCSCKPKKISREVLTDSTSPRENGKATQTVYTPNNFKEKATVVKPDNTQKSNQAKFPVEQKAANIQTDDWSHDPLCKCGCCPKTKVETGSKSVLTEKKSLQNVATSDRKITGSKNVFSNCYGESEEAKRKLCVPYNFENISRTSKNLQFSLCSEKKDCSCDAYDVKEALKRGIVLPTSDICLQNKKIRINGVSKERKGDEDKSELSSSNGNETTDTLSSSSSDSKRKKNKEKEKKEKKKKEKEKKAKKEKKTKKKKDSESSSKSTPREKSGKKKKEQTTNCFKPRKKKSKCDEYCLGIVSEDRSMQTTPIKTLDKSEEASFQNANDGKFVSTSTDSEVAMQVSPAVDEFKKSKKNKETYSVDEKRDEGTETKRAVNQDKETAPSYDNIRLTTKADSKVRFDKDQNNEKEKSNDICAKCGRLRRDCSSGCRNTIIIPYASNSNRGIPASEVESLRMMIKMQSKDTNRQFNNIMSELNHQKSEVRRLNEMYQKMLENFYDLQKSTHSGRSQSKKDSDLSYDCRCGHQSKDTKRGINNNMKECGCFSSDECQVTKKYVTPSKKSNETSDSNNSAMMNSRKLRRFGPPNTAVAINRCDICNVEIAGNSIRACLQSKEADYHDGDKQKKNLLNLSRQTSRLNNISERKEPVPIGSYGDEGQIVPNNTGSVSTIYKHDIKDRRTDRQTDKNANGKHLDNKNDYSHRGQRGKFPQPQEVIAPTETEDVESDKIPRRTYSSRILIWLKKSWISIRHRTEECRERDRRRREERTFKCMLDYCHDKTKKAATGMYRAAKYLKKVI